MFLTINFGFLAAIAAYKNNHYCLISHTINSVFGVYNFFLPELEAKNALKIFTNLMTVACPGVCKVQTHLKYKAVFCL